MPSAASRTELCTTRADGCLVPILRLDNVFGHIVVQGFIIDHGANQWIENFWLPQNAKYSQSGRGGEKKKKKSWLQVDDPE